MGKIIVDRRRDRSRGQIAARRRYPRVNLPFGGFYESPERVLVAKGGNLNFRGAFVATSVPDRPGAEATVRLSLPGRAVMLRLRGRVVWSNRSPEEGPMGMGIRFLGVEEWQIKRIAAAVLRTGGFRSLPRIQLDSVGERRKS